MLRVRVLLRSGGAIADVGLQCMVRELETPADDRFQIITDADADSRVYDPTCLAINRSDEWSYTDHLKPRWYARRQAKFL